MKKFLTEAFFDLSDFAHKSIFDECTYAWEALGKLEAFFKKIPLGVIRSEVPSTAYLVNPELISIGKNTRVEPGAYIAGPCIIGNGCEIRHGAYVRGNVLTGDGCVIGHDTEIKNSIMLNNAAAAHFNYIGDSILGNRVNLGAGVKLANLRLDHAMIVVGVKTQTNLKKMGAIIGDGAQLGCNAVTNPGTLIGKGAFCQPCLAISGYIPSQAKVKSNQKMVIHDVDSRNSI